MLQMSQVTDLKVSCEMVQKKAIETRQAEEKVTSKLYENPSIPHQGHAEEIDHLRKTSQQLKSQLEGILHKK